MLGVDLDGVPVARATGSGGSRSGPRSRPKRVSSPPCESRRRFRLARGTPRATTISSSETCAGPNAHMRGHIPGSRPLVLGSPPPGGGRGVGPALAQEIALRLRRHGITGRERLVLVDRGDGIGAMPAAQMAELAGHPQVCDPRSAGSRPGAGRLDEGAVELEPVREAEADLAPNPGAMPTREGIAGRLGDESLTILDVRTPDEYSGRSGSHVRSAPGAHSRCAEPRGGPAVRSAPGEPAAPERVRELVGLPEGAEIVAYCHSGSRSALATLALRVGGLQRAQLRRLLARVEPARRASARALVAVDRPGGSPVIAEPSAASMSTQWRWR